uniref:hypothetical protein n=1 Tax=Enterocloster clostridioformis TaxID=1531 RepID=UPI001C3E0C60|nr:hypothetical protein [Enterocloster clostridioformis]
MKIQLLSPIEKIRKINSIEQRELSLTGTLSLPLRLGERALIFQGTSQSILTSPVKEILEVSSYGVVFRTCNTIYRLSYTTAPNETGVMCA